MLRFRALAVARNTPNTRNLVKGFARLFEKMDDNASVATSSLAITNDKQRPRKNGGCVGIFFQLFDWNRRFTKKKLFSKRLLPPDRASAKEASKKFGGDEKLPKLRLIADENSGGFPNMNKNGGLAVSTSVGKNGTPSLVARLMGLETMPPGKRDKVSGEFRGGRKDKVVGDDEETTRQEFRPQKLQKTGMVDRRSVTRFGAEALQIKNVLSRSRKHHHHHHHPKLATPVKSTNHYPRKNTSRLIGAATRILEPGGRSRSRNAITYPRSELRPVGDEFRSEPMMGDNLDLSGGFNRCTSATVSCNNCGNVLDIADSTSMRDVHTSVFHSVNPFQVSPNGNSRYARSSVNQEQVFSKNIPIEHGGHVQGSFSNRQSQPQKLASPSYYEKTNHRIVDIGVSSQPKLNCMPFNHVASATDAVSDTKDFVSLNIGLSGRTRARVPAKIEDAKFDKRSKFESGRDNSLSPGQKRQLIPIRKQGESSGVAHSSTNRPRMVNRAASTRKQMGPEPCAVDRVCVEKRPDYQGQSCRVSGGNKTIDGTAFRFNSSMKNRCEAPARVERKRNQNAFTCKTTTRKQFTSNQIDEKFCIQNSFPMASDSLGVIFEEKLHGLTGQVEYDTVIHGTHPRTAPANIFKQLLYALNRERPVTQNDMDFTPQKNHLPHYRSQKYDHNTSFHLHQRKPEIEGALMGGRNSDHFSPGSLLETSFLNDSCCSSSLDNISVRTQHPDSMSYMYDASQYLDSEADPFYCGALLSKGNTRNDFIPDLFTYISQVLCSIDILTSRIKGHILAHVKEVIFNSELVLGNQSPHNPNDLFSFFVCPILLKLDILAEVMWSRFGYFIGSQNSNTRYQLKRFVFDALVEYLDSEYSKYSKCGFRVWTNLPPHMRPVILIHEVVEEVRSWMGFVGVTSDELVDRDMSHCLGKWTDFEIEEYETGATIEVDILQMLVDELVVDLSTGITCYHW